MNLAQLLKVAGMRAVTLGGTTDPPLPLALFGDGSDGDVTISGNTTLTTNMQYNNLTIGGSGKLETAGYKVFVTNTLTINAGGLIGRFPAAGNNPSGFTGGASLSNIGNVYFAQSPGGCQGGNGVIATSAGTAPGNISALDGGAGREGGNGGMGAQNSYGLAGSPPSHTRKPVRTNIESPYFYSGISLVVPGGPGGGGGSGGGDTGSSKRGGAGGGGGDAGGSCLIYARLIVNNGGVGYGIRADGTKGGNGGAGETGGGATGGGGGGSGGGGGVIFICSDTAKSAAGVISVAGGLKGTGGAGQNGGQNGADGYDGTAGVVIYLHRLTGAWQ